MKHRAVLAFTFFVLLFFPANMFAQFPATPPVLHDGANIDSYELFRVGEIKGAVGSKAVYLPKPVYPNQARSAGAEGAVRVEITIDEMGSVASAKAITGHSLLLNPSEEAARKSKFRIARDANNQAVKVSGVLVYNFVIEPAGWVKIGFDLAMLEKNALPESFPLATISKAFRAEWTTEKELLEKLNEFKQTETTNQPETIPPLTREIFERKSVGGAIQNSARMERRLPAPPALNPEQAAIVQNLASALASRLAGDELSFWQFNLGANLVKIMTLSRNPSERQNAAQILRQFAADAPKSVSAEVLAELQTLAATVEKTTRNQDTHREIGKSMAFLFKSK